MMGSHPYHHLALPPRGGAFLGERGVPPAVALTGGEIEIEAEPSVRRIAAAVGS